MTRTFLALLLLLSACSTTPRAYKQAVRPAPAPVARPPIYTPGYSPGPVDPAHAPAGAGASHGSLPMPGAGVPRSPNKRVLPPTSEPGVWAADGAPKASAPPRIFGVEIPFMVDAHGNTLPGDTAWCAKTVTEAADAAKLRDRVEGYPPDARACMAALAYLHCATHSFLWLSEPLTPGQRAGSPAYHSAKDTLNHARSLRNRLCRDVALTDEQKYALDLIHSRWTTTFEREH